jgi:L-alanine-DL-glutamate epimerase-like enolase superfamily enzyme
VIRSVRAFHIGGPTPPEVASARGAFSERHGVLIELSAEGGGVAYGEASPLPGFSRESVEDVSSRVVAFPWASLAFPKTVAEAGVPSIEEPSLRFAIEHALLSLLARKRRSTLSELLASGTPPSIATSVLIGSLGDGGLLERASGAVARGAASLKVKVSAADLAQHRARVAALRLAVGPSLEIRLDFNGTLADLSREEIVDALEALPEANIAFVEEPWGGPRLLELGELPVPWFADESLADPSLCEALLACPDAGGFVLKPSLLGLLGAWNAGALAGTKARDVTVSHLFEGSVALGACAELALALATIATARAPGLDRHAALPCFDLPLPPELASERAEIRGVPLAEQQAFVDAVCARVARERPFFEWTG